jgi:hypothetical protein
MAPGGICKGSSFGRGFLRNQITSSFNVYGRDACNVPNAGLRMPITRSSAMSVAKNSMG